MVYFTQIFKVLNEKHYYQIMGLTVFVTIIYLFPIVYLMWVSYKDAGASFIGYHDILQTGETRPRWEIAVTKFVDWMLMMIYRNDLGWTGFIISLLIHI